MIKYEQLSKPLKVAVVFAYTVGIIYSFAFLVGLLYGILG